jgi:hypothetical protein
MSRVELGVVCDKYVPEIYINPFYFIQWVNPKEHIEKQLLSLQETNLSCKNIHWLVFILVRGIISLNLFFLKPPPPHQLAIVKEKYSVDDNCFSTFFLKKICVSVIDFSWLKFMRKFPDEMCVEVGSVCVYPLCHNL